MAKRPHGEAPLTMVAATTVTAVLAIGFFFFNGALITLERQVVAGL